MKNKIIRFDDRLYFTLFSFIISLVSLIILITFIEELPVRGVIILSVSFSLFLACVFVFPKIGIKINYKLGIIKYFGQIKIKKSSIKMDEIIRVSFLEIPKERKKIFLNYSKGSAGQGIISEPRYVYRNGKIFKFIIELKNSDIIEIPYFNMFKVRSKRRVYKQEMFIRKTIEELNMNLSNLYKNY